MKKDKKNDRNIYLGKKYSNLEVEKHIKKYINKIKYRKSSKVTEEAAKYIADGKVIGWFQDSMEFGPRALGNRSIIADPRDPKMMDYINKEIKNREDFRPFAPSVLYEERNKYFEMNTEESPYMMIVSKVKKCFREKLPAITHVDNTARIQTVKKCDNPKYHELISRFKKITGYGLVLNTSLNNRGMPIVESTLDALEFFIDSKLDYLIVNDFIIERNDFNDSK